MSMTPDGIVLSLCDHSGIMVRPWLIAGYECWIVDLDHEPGVHRHRPHDRLVKVGGDVRKFLPPRSEYRIAFGFPPCTNLANSGARWYKDEERGKGLPGLDLALDVVARTRDILEWTEAPWMVENPIGQLAKYWRDPDHRFDPCDFGGYLGGAGDTYTKRTCLWTGNGFVMPEPKPVEPHEGSRMHLLPANDQRTRIRSQTPKGFARAVYEANR